MYFKIILSVLLSLLPYANCYSQQGLPVYSDYLSDNYYLIHPSMAGAASCTKLRITVRKQWFEQKDAPSLQTLSFNGRIGERSGAGIILFNDKNGYHSQRGIKLTYAYHILFSRDEIDMNQLSFGMSAGLIQNQLNQSTFTEIDPILFGNIQKDSYFNLDFGASYNFLNFYAHATVQGAVESRGQSYNEFERNNLRKYLLSTGYVFGNKNKLLWEPSVLFQQFDKTQEKLIDFNLKAYKNLNFGSIWAVLSYRRSFDGVPYYNDTTERLQYVTPILGINYKNFMFAYTYTQITGNAKFNNEAYHQITLGLNLFCKRERYNCYCPAVN
jgi:type IX secretion system PorP/SprF family membrane protein